MRSQSVLDSYGNWFNSHETFWSITKGKAVSADSLAELVRYHEILRTMFVNPRLEWNPHTQGVYGNAVAGRPVNTAWARELRTVFALLGTAWVQTNGQVKLTPVGAELLRRTNARGLLERQVWKYQLTNPQLSESLTGDIKVLPHYVLLDLLCEDKNHRSVSREEFVFFVSRIRNMDDLPRVREALVSYRKSSPRLKANFKSKLDSNLVTKIERIFSYAANFLAIPRYLEYSPGQVAVVEPQEADRVLNWFRSGHDQYIEFQTPKDWFSHYGNLEATPGPLDAMEYYRKIGRAKAAGEAYAKAVDKGFITPEETDKEFECRVEGEAALETWLSAHLGRLEPGLFYIQRQYETEDAGRIDILARDPGSNYVVIELKRDTASDVAMGQLLRYIGWVRMYLSEGKMVRGYIVGDGFDDKMTYALLSNDALDTMCKLRDYKSLSIRLEITRSPEACTAQVVELPTSP